MPKRLKDFARHQEFWLAIVFVVLFVGLSIASPNFLSLQNGVDLISSYAYTGILVSALLVVLVAGGCHPRVTRNLGTGEVPAHGRRMASATHTVHHGGGSRLLLPVGPAHPSAD